MKTIVKNNCGNLVITFDEYMYIDSKSEFLAECEKLQGGYFRFKITDQNMRRIECDYDSLLSKYRNSGDLFLEHELFETDGYIELIGVSRKERLITTEEVRSEKQSIHNNHCSFVADYLDKNGSFADGEKTHVINKISNSCRGKDCIDNFRIAIKGDLRAEGYYQGVAENGCCGFYDEEISLNSGKIIMFGFNYGH